MYRTSSGFAIVCQSSLVLGVAILFSVVTFIKVCELPKPKPSNIWSTISTLPPKNYLLRVNHKPFDSRTYFSQALASKTLCHLRRPHSRILQVTVPLFWVSLTAHQKDTQRFEPRGWGGKIKQNFTHTIHGRGILTYIGLILGQYTIHGFFGCMTKKHSGPSTNYAWAPFLCWRRWNFMGRNYPSWN